MQKRKEKDSNVKGRKKSGGKVIKLTKLEWNRVMKGQNNGHIMRTRHIAAFGLSRSNNINIYVTFITDLSGTLLAQCKSHNSIKEEYQDFLLQSVAFTAYSV